MKSVILLLCLVALCGCTHFQHGLARERKVDVFPPTEDVVAFLRAFPGVTSVSVLRHEGRSNLERALGLNEGTVEEIVIGFGDFSFHISFHTRKSGRTLMVWRHENAERPFRYSLEDMREKMKDVISALRSQFPEIPSWEAMDEWAMGPEGK